MPYRKIESLPKGVAEHLPKHAQKIYMEAYNNAFKQYADPKKRKSDAPQEDTAHKVAWAAVKKKYKKDPSSDKWHKK